MFNLRSHQLGVFSANDAGKAEKSWGLFGLLVSWFTPGSCDQEAETVRSLYSPQGPLPHEANMQFHLPNLRCKNRSLGRDAFRQRNRLLYKGSFYVEGPWRIALCSRSPSLYRSQGHCTLSEAWITKENEGLDHIRSRKLCELGVLGEHWDRSVWMKIECLTGIGSRRCNGSTKCFCECVMEQGVKVRQNRGSCWPQAFQKADVGEKRDPERTQALDHGHVLLFAFSCVRSHGTDCVGAIEVACLCTYLKSSWAPYICLPANHHAGWVIETIIPNHRLTHLFVKVQCFFYFSMRRQRCRTVHSPLSCNTLGFHSTTSKLSLP